MSYADAGNNIYDVKHGHWIKGIVYDITCLNCYFPLCISDSEIPKMKYCPNCGAKMDERRYGRMISIKGLEMQTDCKKCPLMATDGVDELNSMMCLALWATKHKVKHCVEGKILDDCPLEEIVTCKDCEYNYKGTCEIDGLFVIDDYFCGNGKRRE